MQAQGNDFVILNALQHPLADLDFEALAQSMCRRRFSIGADGLVLLMPTPEADAQMIIYNNDGSRAEMCGSALRCVAQLSSLHYDKYRLQILTDSGIKSAEILPQDGIVRVNLGRARILKAAYTVESFIGDLVDIGNPHYVLWRDDLRDDPQLKYGSHLEHHPAFETPVNVHFARVLSPTQIEMKIWEHACGATLACGTGAACTVSSGIHRGLLEHDVKVLVPGGELGISYVAESGDLLLSGTVSTAFTGIFTWKA